MELATKFLFNLLLRLIRPQMICDIGSMDGADALRFKKILPESQVVIFEANPHNFFIISQNNTIQQKDISSFNEIVWNENGNKEFYVVKPSQIKGVDEHLQGMSSVFPRASQTQEEIIVLKTVRLDSKIREMCEPESIALWIDVEGASYEALEGIRGIRDHVKLIHAEVETEPVWRDQKVRSDVLALTESMGFVLLGHGRNKQQHDVVLINKELIAASPMKFKIVTFLAFLRAFRINRFFNISEEFS